MCFNMYTIYSPDTYIQTRSKPEGYDSDIESFLGLNSELKGTSIK